MSTTYRWTVWTESTAEMRRGGASGHGTLTFKRDSKAATEQAMKAFYQTIRQNMPDGREARAWLEKSTNYGPEFLVKLKLRVEKSSTMPNAWIHAWVDQYNATIASFLVEIDPASGLRTMRTGKLLKGTSS